METVKAVPRKRHLKVSLIGLIMLIMLGFFGYILSGAYFAQQKAAQTFLPIKAIIQSSSVGSIRPGNSRTSTIYRINILYRYTVEDHDYQGQRYAYMTPGLANYNQAKKLVDQYPPGTQITIYYNPANPKISLVNAQPAPLPSPIMIAPILLLGLVGIFMLGLGLYKKPLSVK